MTAEGRYDTPPTAEEMDAMIARARETIIDHCAVGLAHVGNPNERDDIAELGGSGTLVQANGAFGILTAAHVVRDFIQKGERAIGIAFYDGFKGREKVRLGVHHTWIAPEDGSDGPDLAVIVLNPNDASRLSNTHPFYRLDAPDRQAQMRMFTVDEGGWLVVGGVGEWSQGPVRPEGSHNVKAFGGLIVGPEFKRERVSEPHDYIETEINYRDNPDATPRSFGGMSGGGAWHLLPSPENTLVFYLGGVIFYQSALVDDRRTVYCHGRRSVYNVACRALAGN
jgi:hypothetical protein